MKLFVKDYAGFKIYFEALGEHLTLNELLPDYSEEQLKEIAQNNVIFCANVSAYKAGVRLADDVLGGCIYGSEEEFYTTHAKDYFEGMCDTVTEQAKLRLPELIKELKS